MNLFENLQLMKEDKNVNLTDEQIAVINIANDDIDGYEGGSKPFKYSYSISGYQDALSYIKDVIELSDSELQEEIDKEIRNIRLSHEYESKEIKKEAKYNSNINTSNELYTEIQKILNNASLDEDTISLNDLFNCYSVEALQDLYDFIATEYDYDNDYIGIITNDDNLWYEFNKLLTNNRVKLDYIFNCFSFDRLKELYDYLLSEYQDNWDEDDEDLEEATSGIGGAYTTQAIDIPPKAFSKILKTTKENLKFDSQIDYNSLSDYNIEFFENSAGVYKVVTPDGDKLDIDIELSDDDKYFVSLPSEDVRSVNRDLTTAIIDVINKLYNFSINEDINSSGKTRKNRSIYDDYEFKIGKESTINGLLEISKDLDSTKYLSNKDKKELKDYITSRCKTLKTEAVTKFYGKEWTDEEIKKAIDVAKKNPDAIYYMDPNECASPFTYNGKTYYIVGDGKEIVFDGKDCVVYLTVDEELNRYLSYYEIKWIPYSDGDVENGMSAPDYEINEVPYKVVEV